MFVVDIIDFTKVKHFCVLFGDYKRLILPNIDKTGDIVFVLCVHSRLQINKKYQQQPQNLAENCNTDGWLAVNLVESFGSTKKSSWRTQ